MWKIIRNRLATRRRKIDHRTDIFSLGVTLYECLTLARPFDGRTSHEVLRKVLLQEPKDPRRLIPRIPRDLSAIGFKAMEKAMIHAETAKRRPMPQGSTKRSTFIASACLACARIHMALGAVSSDPCPPGGSAPDPDP